MEYRQRSYPMFSACGLNCGLCPRYQTDGASKCPGCSGNNFSTKHPACGILSCCQRKGLEYCFECELFPCGKYEGADLSDSFISHKNQLNDLSKAKKQGIQAYKTELDEKINILRFLLENYNDGRKKSFFCIAVNLFDINDLRLAVERLESTVEKDMPAKEKGAVAAGLFNDMANERDIFLKLRKKGE